MTIKFKFTEPEILAALKGYNDALLDERIPDRGEMLEVYQIMRALTEYEKVRKAK